MKISSRLRLCLFAAIAIPAFAMPCVAQNIRTVLFVKVKLGQEDNWKSAVKDLVALDKKSGSKQGQTMWDSQTGPAQHAVVWYSSKWKEMDEDDPAMKGSEAERARVFARLDSTTDSIEYWVDELQPDMTARSNDIPAMVRVGRLRIVSGKMDEVEALLRERVIPAIKKTGATDYGYAEARFGTPTNEIHSYLGIKGWADLDGTIGPQKGMTADEYKAFQAKILPLLESIEWSIWKFNPELSYIPPK